MNVRRVLAGIRHDVHQKVAGRKRILGGEVWVKNEPGKGATFFLTLPAG